jgi:DNA-binding IscR family transcriptional regulator
VLAASVPTNPVVVRRVTALLAKAGLIATRPGASGGAWLLHRPEDISLDTVLRAVNGCAHLGSPPAGAKGCPISEHIPRQVAKALTAADEAAVQDHYRRPAGREPAVTGGLCAAFLLPRRGLTAR